MKRFNISSSCLPSGRESTVNVSSKLNKRPNDIKQLNGSVWQFFEPPLDGDGVPKVEVLFFHGAQLSSDAEAFWKTWLSRDETVVWPTAWLAQKFPKARILFISYDLVIRRSYGSSGQLDVYQIVENLIHDIIWSSTCKAGQKCPIIFVGHCFGGIIIKQFLIRCCELTSRWHGEDLSTRERVLLQYCKAIFYYSTPHGGSKLMDGLSYTDNVHQSIVDFLKTFSPHTARINMQFTKLRHNANLKWVCQGIGETVETKLRGSKKTMVVSEASAVQDMDKMYWAHHADHFNVARAENDFSCNIFTMLCDLIDDYYKKSPSSIPAASLISDAEHYGIEKSRALCNLAVQDQPLKDKSRALCNLAVQDQPLKEKSRALCNSAVQDQPLEKILDFSGQLDNLVKSMDQDHNLDLAKHAARTIAHLSSNNDLTVKHKVAFFPTLLQTLAVSLLKDQNFTLQTYAAWALSNLTYATDQPIQQKILDVSLQSLVVSLSKDQNHPLQMYAAGALHNLACGDESLKRKLMNFPRLLETLVKSTQQDCNFGLAKLAAGAITNLSSGTDTTINHKVAFFPNMLHSLVVSLSKDQNPPLQMNAAGALCNLANVDQPLREKILHFPGLLDSLIKSMDHDYNLGLAEEAARAIANLSSATNQYFTNRHNFAFFPTMLQSLVVSSSNDHLPVEMHAAGALCNLANGNQPLRKKILDFPRLLENLVKSMDQDCNLGLAEQAALAIVNLSSGTNLTIKHKVAFFPTMLQSLVVSLSKDRNPPLQTSTAGALSNLANGDQQLREKILDFPELLDNFLKFINQNCNLGLAQEAARAIASLLRGTNRYFTNRHKVAFFLTMLQNLVATVIIKGLKSFCANACGRGFG